MKLAITIFLILTLIGPVWILLTGQIDFHANWRTANRASAQLAPDPLKSREAIIQVYSARAFNWRGLFAVHTWIATKEKNASHYMVYQVVGWRKWQGFPPLMMAQDIPDRSWYNQTPKIIFDLRGATAERLIPRVTAVAKTYPYADNYDLWPGPNSNTFPAYIARNIPELHLALPSTAIGKDFLPGYHFFAPAPSGTGYQFSLFGLCGILIAREEGLEINIFGFVYGINPSKFAIILPGLGEVSILSSK